MHKFYFPNFGLGPSAYVGNKIKLSISTWNGPRTTNVQETINIESNETNCYDIILNNEDTANRFASFSCSTSGKIIIKLTLNVTDMDSVNFIEASQTFHAFYLSVEHCLITFPVIKNIMININNLTLTWDVSSFNNCTNYKLKYVITYYSDESNTIELSEDLMVSLNDKSFKYLSILPRMYDSDQAIADGELYYKNFSLCNTRKPQINYFECTNCKKFSRDGIEQNIAYQNNATFQFSIFDAGENCPPDLTISLNFYGIGNTFAINNNSLDYKVEFPLRESSDVYNFNFLISGYSYESFINSDLLTYIKSIKKCIVSPLTQSPVLLDDKIRYFHYGDSKMEVNFSLISNLYSDCLIRMQDIWFIIQTLSPLNMYLVPF